MRRLRFKFPGRAGARPCLALLALLCAASLACSACTSAEALAPIALTQAPVASGALPAPTAEPTPAPTPTPSPTPEPAPEPVTITVRAVGDLMMHETQFVSARTEDGGYDFSEYFSLIQDELDCADLTVGNLETPMTGGEPRGYPSFNAPDEYADAILAAGFDAVSLANNHILDRGGDGLTSTAHILEEKGLPCFGAYARGEEHEPLVLDVQGVKIALLGFAEHLNGHADKNGQVDMLDDQTIAARMEEARKAGADYIIAMPHWGAEGVSTESASSRKWAGKLADAGADLILGSHPHVLQPISSVEAKDGRTVPVVYSMGNFISNQQREPHSTGVIIEVTLTKTEEGVSLDSMRYIPIFVLKYDKGRGRSGYQVLPVAEYKAGTYSLMNDRHRRRIKNAWEFALKTLGTDGAQPYLPEE